MVPVPDFFIIGAAKAGTTALYDYLKQHPDVFLPEEKEPHFFDHNENFQKGIDWYNKSFFSNSAGYTATGEASPSYIRNFQKVIPRIESLYPKSVLPKFIIILRDPVQRAWSHYLHRKRFHVEEKSFENALASEKERLKAEPDDWVGYYKDGLYGHQISKWFKAFPREHFFVLLNDDLKNDHMSCLAQICEFLGVDVENFCPDQLVSNPASKPRFPSLMKILAKENMVKKLTRIFVKNTKSKERIIKTVTRLNLRPAPKEAMPKNIETALRERFLTDIELLENLIDRDLSAWKP